MATEATDLKIMSLMEGSTRVEATKASGIPSLTHLVDVARSCRAWVADQLGVGVEHPTTGGGGGLLLGVDYPG